MAGELISTLKKKKRQVGNDLSNLPQKSLHSKKISTPCLEGMVVILYDANQLVKAKKAIIQFCTCCSFLGSCQTMCPKSWTWTTQGCSVTSPNLWVLSTPRMRLRSATSKLSHFLTFSVKLLYYSLSVQKTGMFVCVCVCVATCICFV